MDLWRRKRKKQLCEIDCIASFLKKKKKKINNNNKHHRSLKKKKKHHIPNIHILLANYIYV